MGGGGSKVDSVDEVYNDRMATIAEKQQEWAQDYYNMWSTHFKPYEIAQAQTNLGNMGLENSLYRGQLEAKRDMLTEEKGLYSDQLNTLKSLMPQETDLYKKQLAANSKFIDASTQGVDVNERMGLATADVSNAWKGVSEANTRANARMGVNANSGRFQGTQAALQTQQASQLAQARTGARVGAEQENYERLTRAAASRQEPATLFKGLNFLGLTPQQ